LLVILIIGISRPPIDCPAESNLTNSNAEAV